MNQRQTGTNNNYKVFARIRPIDYQQKMIECSSDNTVSIKDPTSKNKEKQTFSFNGVFESSSQQETVWSTVCEPVLQKVIEGHNACLMSYGQTGSGKTFTIFGEDEKYSINNINLYVDGRKDKRGLICRTVEFLFKKAQELEDIREFVLSCSLCEIYLDQVRDLGKPYAQSINEDRTKNAGNQNSALQNYENENLTIYENTNGQIVVKDLTQIQITSMNELYDFIAAGFQLREKFESKGNQTWARAHSIFTCNLVQKDKENENIPFMNSTIQFVDLAGSERIAKSLTEGHKFQEAILINSSLTALSKCLSQIAKANKNVPYRESKLTKVLQNCMSFSSHTILIVNLNPNESNYEESLSTLQYAERTRNAMTYKGVPERQSMNFMASEENAIYSSMGGGADKKTIDKLKEEISDLKSKIEYANREHKEKMAKIQDLLGIDTDLDKIMNKSSQKELNQFKLQKEALVKLENMTKSNADLENYIKRLHNVIEDQKKDANVNMEKQQCVIIEQREQIKKLKELVQQNKKKAENDIQQLNGEREQEIRNMIDFSNQLLEEKAQKIINLPQEIDKRTRENGNINEAKKATKHEVEREMKTQIENLKTEYQKLLDTTKQQYEYFLQQKNEEMDNYVKQLKQYREKKKAEIEELQEELQDLYEIIQKEQKIINKVETGQYSGGIRSFNIPNRDKPHQPNRQKHKNLFKLLDQKHISQHQTEETKKTNLNTKKTVTLKSEGEEDPVVEQKTGSKKQLVIKDQVFASLDDMVDLNVNINKLKNKEEFDTLKVYAERIKDSLMQSLMREKELKERVSQFDTINNNVDINSLLKEKEEYKSKYMAEVKKHNQSRITIESQKRVLTAKFQHSPNHSSAVAIIRPQTVQDRRFKSGTNFFPGVTTGSNMLK